MQKSSAQTNRTHRQENISHHKKPEDISLDEWQIMLRKQAALRQHFEVTNISPHTFFSDFAVYNPASDTVYKTSLRREAEGGNFCSCPDFSINRLGTCKHIEYLLFYLTHEQNNQQAMTHCIATDYSSISLRYGKERRIYLRVGTRNKRAILKCAKKYFDRDGYLREKARFHIDTFIERINRIDPCFRVYPDAADYIHQITTKQERNKKIDQLFKKGIHSPYFNELVKTTLYPYQKEGIIFGAKAGRVLIADEMGLGKTIQTIAIAELLARECGLKRAVIVCPTSLKYQWQSEIEKFAPRPTIIIEGNIIKRKRLYRQHAFYSIVSYNVLRHDRDYINDLSPDLIILDEAQRIKNWKTKTAQAVKKLNAEYSVVLTGTPLENKIEELHSIVEFIDRYKLDALFRFLDKHQLCNEDGTLIGYHRLHEIKYSLADIMIRRTRKEIANQLPKRNDNTYFVSMTREQLKYHDSFHVQVCRLVRIWKEQGFLSQEDRERLLILLNCMRMICDSTFILDQKTRHDTKIDELMIILNKISEQYNHKIVIFSQWKRMTKLISEELDKLGSHYEYLHGSLPAKKRKEVVANFHHDPGSKIFLSTDAGGLGLNLQCANIIINMDIPWNPALLEQRIGRVYRLGQCKDVRVINMVSQDSIEHRILYLLKFKQSVFKGVLENGKDTVRKDEKNFLKTVEELIST